MEGMATQGGTTTRQDSRVADTWSIDTTHSSLSFSVTYMGLTKVHGRFKDMKGKIEHVSGGEPTVQLDIPMWSIDTGNERRDKHLLSDDFFDMAANPKIHFRSTGLKGDMAEPGATFELHGDLTIRGTTKPIVLDCVFVGRGKDMQGRPMMSYSVLGKLDRKEFGVGWNQTLRSGGFLISNTVEIQADLQVVQKDGVVV